MLTKGELLTMENICYNIYMSYKGLVIHIVTAKNY